MKKLYLVLMLMLLSAFLLLPAVSSEGDNCFYCGEYRYGDWLCECGCCSIEAEPAECWAATHCWECGDCFNTMEKFCVECHLCQSCYLDAVEHCYGCEECYAGNAEEELCGICWFCADCMGGLCDGCGFCAGCVELEGMHCPECDGCYGEYGMCDDEGEHCKECCLICEQCDRCVFDDGLELCEECNACEECCRDAAQSEGCDCGEYCVESSDWYEHVCLDCGTPYCQIDQCELCELCLDCCEGNSDCSEGLCVMDDEYDYHFCEDCGSCFHDVDACEDCGDVGELRCEDCSASITEDAGCDCGDMCFNMAGFDTHVATEHKGADGSHNAKPQNTWTFDMNYHWRDCCLCSDASHINEKEKHAYDYFGICAVCGFDSKTKIVILRQPKSRIVEVSDNEAYVGEPYNIEENQVSFSVAAVGEGELKYQWYERYGASEWKPLQDKMDYFIANSKFYTVYGSKTAKLTIAVPVDACYAEYAYRVVITDGEGNTVTSAAAQIASKHIYKETVAHKGALINIIHQANNNDNIGVYATNGHYVLCHGDGCEAEKLVSHNYGKAVREYVDNTDYSVWTEFVCKDCGFVNYIKKHEHYFYDPENGDFEVDYTYKNSVNHRLKCLYPGCDKTTLEAHVFMPWGNHGTPHQTIDGKGIPFKECGLCAYSYTKSPLYFDFVKEENVTADWTKENDLVYVRYGYASGDVYKLGDNMYITFAPTDADKKDSIKMTNPKCVGWKVFYNGKDVSDLDVTSSSSFTKLEGEAKWVVKISKFSSHTGGGMFSFIPVIDTKECQHTSGTSIFGAYKPICKTDGYTGDRKCVDCGYIVQYGEAIPGGEEHTGELKLIEGTARKGSCEYRGYEGDYKCSHCGAKIKGKTTQKEHTGKITVKNAKKATCDSFGYSGDSYCSCGVMVKEGDLILPTHGKLVTLNYKEANCMHDGYSGDVQCKDCGIFVRYGHTVKGGEHAWSDYSVLDAVNHKSYCKVSGCNEHMTEAHVDADRNLVCDTCGYSWGDDGEYISSILFNITPPEIGAKGDYTKFDTKRFYSDNSGLPYSRYSNGIGWENVTSGTFLLPGGTEVFREGNVYKIYIFFRAKEGYSFATDLTATVNGNSAVAEYIDDVFASVEYTFPKLDHKHDYTLMRNENSHHYECLVCSVVKDAGSHVFDANGRCKECGYSKNTNNPFTDIKASDYFFDAVIWAKDTGITVGTTATTFSPYDTCTRAQGITFLWRAAGKPTAKNKVNPFTDVKTTDYFYDAVLWGVEEGIVVGTSKTTFTPNQTCSSAHIITMLFRAMKIGTNGWYEEARTWAKGEGLLDGTKFVVSPEEPCPRAGIVYFLYMFYEK